MPIFTNMIRIGEMKMPDTENNNDNNTGNNDTEEAGKGENEVTKEEEKEEISSEPTAKEQDILYQQRQEQDKEERKKREEEEKRRYEELQKKIDEGNKRNEEQIKRLEEERKKEKEKAEMAMFMQKQTGMTELSRSEFEKHREKIDEGMKEMDKIDPSYIRSSDEFKYFKGSMEEVDRLSKEMTIPATSRELRKFSKAYRTLAEDADNYLDHKKKDKKPSKIARERISFVTEKKQFAEANRDYWKEQYIESLKVKKLDEDNLRINAQNINDFMDDLDEVDPFYVKSSNEFKNVKDCLKDLNYIAKRMGENPSKEELRNYMLATKRLDKACDQYVTYKGDPANSNSYKRLDFVNDLKEFTQNNSADFEKLAKEKGYEFEFTDFELTYGTGLVEKEPKKPKEVTASKLSDEDLLKEDQPGKSEDKDNEFEEIEGIKSEDFWDREFGDIAKLKGIDEVSLKQNAQLIKELGDDISKLDGRFFKAPEEFRNIKKTAGELKTLADNMASAPGDVTSEQLDAYRQKGSELMEAANVYVNAQETKRNLEKNDKDTIKRIDCAIKVRECMKLNIDSVESLQDDIKKEAEAELKAQKTVNVKDLQAVAKEKEADAYSKQVDLGSDVCKKAYTGNVDVRQMNNPHQYAVTNSGIQALGEMYLMASGDYELEDIVNPDSLKEEKANAGKEVIKHISAGREENQKWLAATVYQGQKKCMKMMDDYAKNFDLTDPSFLQSEECANLGHICQTMNESFKAMDNCKEQYISIAKELDGKDINFGGHRQEMKNDIYLVSTLTSSAKKMHENVVKSEENPENNMLKSKVMENAVIATTTRNLIGEAQKNNPDAAVTGLLRNNEEPERAKNLINGMTNDAKLKEFNGNLSLNQETYDRNFGSIVNGRLFGNVTVAEKDGDITVSNLPSVEKMEKEQTYAKMSDVKLDRIVQEQNRKSEDLLKSGKIDNPNQADVMERAKDSRLKLAELGKKEGELNDADLKLAKGYMKDIVAEKFIAYAANNNIRLDPEAYDYTSGVDRLPAFQQEVSNISQGSIKRFLAEDRGTELLKETIVEQKQILDEQMIKEAENTPEKEMEAAREKKAELKVPEVESSPQLGPAMM